MTIKEREYKFLLTVKARRELRALCPNGDITNLAEFLDGPEVEENTTKLMILLNHGYEDYLAYWENDYEPEYLTPDLIENLSMEQYRELQDEVITAMRKGLGISVEAEEAKAKGKKKAEASEQN